MSYVCLVSSSKENKDKSFTLRLSAETVKELQKKADENEASIASIIRIAIKQYLKR